MITQICTCYVITTKEKLAIKAHFLAPWSDTPEGHVTAFALQLDRRQVKCKDHGDTFTDDDKVDRFVAQMYACSLSEAKFLDNWEETANKLWRATQPHFPRKFKKERRKLKCENAQKNYESSAVLREAPCPHNLEPPKGGATATAADDSFTTKMEYTAALEEKANTQANRIIDLGASVDGQTVLTDTTDYAASAVSTGTDKELTYGGYPSDPRSQNSTCTPSSSMDPRDANP